MNAYARIKPAKNGRLPRAMTSGRVDRVVAVSWPTALRAQPGAPDKSGVAGFVETTVNEQLGHFLESIRPTQAISKAIQLLRQKAAGRRELTRRKALARQPSGKLWDCASKEKAALKFMSRAIRQRLGEGGQGRISSDLPLKARF